MIAGSITVRGQTFFIPEKDQLPMSLMIHYMTGNVHGMLQSIFGEDQFAKILEMDLNFAELEDLVSQLGKLYEV